MLFWHQSSQLPSKSFTCGHCGNPLASNVGYYRGQYEDGSGGMIEHIYICHHCHKPTYFGSGKQIPGIRPGSDVNGIDDAGVASLYNEARDCFSKNAFTATVLSCRKLLMHIAVAKGDAPGKNFIDYVEYLSSKGYVPPDAKTWVDHIRTKGNEANHEIVIMSEEEAKDLIAFCEMLLKLVYEFPSVSKKYIKSPIT
ncbi:MAG: DUF4145 domain-containing protein [Candidatus Nealsonbacteria bacterium]|nr:DUF4145 domain-containing protein [Candidatus Nealsonbacteria bacterium]